MSSDLRWNKILVLLLDCWYDNKKHVENAEVPTGEACLNCTCNKSVLLCYLRVCPQLPNPPPLGCILVHRYKTCCPELICNGNVVSVYVKFYKYTIFWSV